MLRPSEYVDDWMRLVRRGVKSYSDVSWRLRDAREYHRERSALSIDDRDAGQRGFRVEIPLWWGSF